MDTPQKLTVSASPHYHQGDSTASLMGEVLLALLPAGVMSVVLFSWRSLLLITLSVISCLVFEYVSQKIWHRTIRIGDLSAVVTGVLLAFNLPVTVSWWIPVIGAFVAIVVVKQLFGGIGQNFVNPALVGRVVLMVSFPSQMALSQWPMPGADGVTSPSPLTDLANQTVPSITQMFTTPTQYDPLSMLLGFRPGSLGETCAIALLIGGAYLCFRKVISPIIPLFFTGTTIAIAWIAGQNPYYHLLSGGLLLGAVFMATDYTTCPINHKGKVIYAIGCGLLTAVIRLWGNMPEGVSIAILLMNITVPLIERMTTPKPFGTPKKTAKKQEGTL